MATKVQPGFIQKNNPKLKMISKQINQITPGVKGVYRAMMTLMRKHGALGIAAPEMGHNICLLALKVDKKIITMINPVVVHELKEVYEDIEKCFSIDAAETPFVVERSKGITVEWTDMKGKKHSSDFGYLEARIILHCIDHFNGVLINA